MARILPTKEEDGGEAGSEIQILLPVSVAWTFLLVAARRG